MSADQSQTKDAAVYDGRLSSEQSNFRLILRLFKLAWLFRWQTITVVALQIFTVSMMLYGLSLIGFGVDVIGQVSGVSDKEPMYPFGLAPPEDWPPLAKVFAASVIILAVGSLRFVFDRGSKVRVAALVQDIIVHLRSRVYNKLQRLSFRFFDANISGSIINRVTRDVQMVRMFIDGVVIQVMMLVISLSFFLAVMLSIHGWLTLACLATTPVLWILTGMFSRMVKPEYRRNRELFDDAVLKLSENVQGVHVVKGFSRQQEEIAKFTEANAAVRDQKGKIFRQVSTFVPLITMVTHVNFTVLLLVGGWIYIHNEDFTIGTLIFFSGMLQQFSMQVGNVAQLADAMQNSLTGAQRVFEVLDAPVEVENPKHPVPLGRSEGRVDFQNVTFRYNEGDDAALENINLRVEPGQMVAILGATGSGKSTLLSLIPRFYDPTRGTVRLDGKDLREVELAELRRNIGIVFQESFLFSTTVAENIAFGHPEATSEQIEKAAHIAAAHDFIMNDLSDGYDTLLTEGGGNLSGGQRQRLAIARAVLLEPPILLLDDPTAAIDPETEHEILEAMNNAMEGRTTFVVAHRLSTLRRADLVVVLEKGRIVETGTHEELMSTGGHYRHAADLQIADDESKRLLGMGVGDE
ncbi:MAG: ABC transporter ATP-binding protein [Phycisphaeraceae bacterium]